MKARLACGFFAVESFFGPVSKKAGAFNAQIPPPKTKIFNTLKKKDIFDWARWRATRVDGPLLSDSQRASLGPRRKSPRVPARIIYLMFNV